MPLYTYRCADCGAHLEVLHGIGKEREFCGLDCQRKDAGAFGRGRITRGLDAAQVSTRSKGSPDTDVLRSMVSMGAEEREALQQKGREKLGGELTERDLDKLRDGGVSVYRKDGDGYTREGGDSDLPDRLPGS